MEVKINREIREYTESMFFGLSLRQFIFSLASCVVAVAVYFILKPLLGLETTSWVCILAAVPFAALGFIKYNGMTAEQFLWAVITSEILIPKHLTFDNGDYYYDWMTDPKREQRLKKEKLAEEKAAREAETASKTQTTPLGAESGRLSRYWSWPRWRIHWTWIESGGLFRGITTCPAI